MPITIINKCTNHNSNRFTDQFNEQGLLWAFYISVPLIPLPTLQSTLCSPNDKLIKSKSNHLFCINFRCQPFKLQHKQQHVLCHTGWHASHSINVCELCEVTKQQNSRSYTSPITISIWFSKIICDASEIHSLLLNCRLAVPWLWFVVAEADSTTRQWKTEWHQTADCSHFWIKTSFSYTTLTSFSSLHNQVYKSTPKLITPQFNLSSQKRSFKLGILERSPSYHWITWKYSPKKVRPQQLISFWRKKRKNEFVFFRKNVASCSQISTLFSQWYISEKTNKRTQSRCYC